MTNHPNPHDSLPATLEELMQQKNAVLEEIRAQRACINRIGREVMTPFTPTVQKGNHLLNAFNKGMAVFDGIMLGLKVMRKFRKIFGGKRKYRSY